MYRQDKELSSTAGGDRQPCFWILARGKFTFVYLIINSGQIVDFDKSFVSVFTTKLSKLVNFQLVTVRDKLSRADSAASRG